jgi:hypothetical protein
MCVCVDRGWAVCGGDEWLDRQKRDESKYNNQKGGVKRKKKTRAVQQNRNRDSVVDNDTELNHVFASLATVCVSKNHAHTYLDDFERGLVLFGAL